jgi:hypothetical protein
MGSLLIAAFSTYGVTCALITLDLDSTIPTCEKKIPDHTHDETCFYSTRCHLQGTAPLTLQS